MSVRIEIVNSMELAEVIIGFQKEMAFETEGLNLEEGPLSQGVKTVIRDPSKGTYYIASIDNEVAGSLLLIPEWSDWRNKTVLWIHSVYVKPEFRKHGIFRKMYEHLRDMVLTREDLAGLRLFVDKRNDKAQKVYEAIGMSNEHYDLYEWLQ